MEIVARVLVCYPSLVVVVGHQKSTSSGMSGTDHASNAKNTILLAACGNNELLPQNPELPADLFTSCLTTPIRMALRWWVLLIILYTYTQSCRPLSLYSETLVPASLLFFFKSRLWLYLRISEVLRSFRRFLQAPKSGHRTIQLHGAERCGKGKTSVFFHARIRRGHRYSDQH